MNKEDKIIREIVSVPLRKWTYINDEHFFITCRGSLVSLRQPDNGVIVLVIDGIMFRSNPISYLWIALWKYHQSKQRHLVSVIDINSIYSSLFLKRNNNAAKAK